MHFWNELLVLHSIVSMKCFLGKKSVATLFASESKTHPELLPQKTYSSLNFYFLCFNNNARITLDFQLFVTSAHASRS